MNRLVLACVVLVLPPLVSVARGQAANRHYPSSRPPLRQTRFVELPLGAVKPQGWLRDQLRIQAEGLTGHLDEFWPDLAQSAWKGGTGDGWERGPYYLDGLVPLAYELDDARLIAKAKVWIEWILASGQPDGWFGPAKNKDRWPRAVAMKVLTQYHEATGDARVIPLLTNYFKYINRTPPDWPDTEWRGVRAMEHVVSAFWLYNRTGDAEILKAADSIHRSCFDWTPFFLDFPYTTEALKAGLKYTHFTHDVNNAMAVKNPALWHLRSGDERDRKASYQGIASLDEHHGQVAGGFGGDEHLSGKRPTQGTELCGVVEYMFSMEKLVEILGDVAFADRLERLAYNANPGTCMPDYWAHQFDQQANQVLCTIAKRQWSHGNDDTSNIYGLEPNYGCCTANMHQGWPKLVSHLWMATHDQGLAAVAYGPCKVKAKVADGQEVTISEETAYPFDGVVRLVLESPRPTRFPLHLRIPVWATGARVVCMGTETPAEAGRFAVVDRMWDPGEVVTISLPMNLRTEPRYNNSVAILRGPLCFSLKIGERYEKLRSHHDKFPVNDWAIHPATPWNYGLLLDRGRPEQSVSVATRAVGKIPFAQDAAPVTLKAKGRALPGWKLEHNSAGDPPMSPAVSNEPTTDLELIPYGSTRLRITEFPTIQE
ncbi:MAG: glycoside hydrolase family 127 protein [Phycisphaerae bacterium]|nr:glycoside hydrolase family 127 protein [Phycisphaerae bacterium]